MEIQRGKYAKKYVNAKYINSKQKISHKFYTAISIYFQLFVMLISAEIKITKHVRIFL